MSGCGTTWFSAKRNAICFEPETDKDLDRLEILLEELKQANQDWRVQKVIDFWVVKLGEPRHDER